jgi:hypothetical protein
MRGAQCNPESAVGVIERRPGPFLLECGNLLPEHEVLDDQIVAGTTDGSDRE